MSTSPVAGPSTGERREEQVAACLLDVNLGELCSLAGVHQRDAHILLGRKDYPTKIKLATELRDSADSLYQRDHDYKSFVDVLLPVFMSILEKGKVSLHSQAPEHVRVLPPTRFPTIPLGSYIFISC
jgi:hypothetical protein